MTRTSIGQRRRAAVGGTLSVLALALGLAMTSQSALAQAAAASDSATPPAAAGDVRSIDAILHAAYDVISGPAGPRDWQRFYSLFAPGARLIRTMRDTTTKVPHVDPLTPREFAALAGDYFSHSAFYEKEIGREVNTFGAVTQAFSAYASRHAPDDATPFARGINSFQLFNDGTRWYIVTIYWDDERSGNKIPDRYLHVTK